MSNIIPRVAAVQDISGFGRCSLTVVMPILSCMGVQVCPVPTAVLSTHSGGFGEMTFEDLTRNMEAYIAHWKTLGLHFDYIYTGFLGNQKQIDIVEEWIKGFKKTKEQQVVVDPVMGDHGKLYKTYDKVMQEKMKLLVKKADIITPNLTEVAFLLDRPYKYEPMRDEELKEILEALADLGPEIVIITGALEETGKSVNIAYDKTNKLYWKIPYEELPVSYPGTGDTFTSVLIGALIQGDRLPVAVQRATHFVSLAIQTTYEYKTDTKEGIMLEKVLYSLFNHEIACHYSAI